MIRRAAAPWPGRLAHVCVSGGGEVTSAAAQCGGVAGPHPPRLPGRLGLGWELCSAACKTIFAKFEKKQLSGRLKTDYNSNALNYLTLQRIHHGEIRPGRHRRRVRPLGGRVHR